MTNVKKTLLASSLGLAMMGAMPVQATTLSELLTYDGGSHVLGVDYANPPLVFQGGGEDQLVDESRTVHIDANTNNQFDAGEVVWGMLGFSDSKSSPAFSQNQITNGQVAVVFSAQITDLVGGAGSAIALDAIADSTNAFDLRQLLDPSLRNSLDDDTVAVVLSHNDTNEDPLNYSAADAQYSDDSFSKFSVANGWSWEASLGLVEASDFFAFKESISGQRQGNEAAALTIQDQAFEVDEWIATDILDFGNNVVTADAVYSATVQIGDAGAQAKGWTFQDDSNVLVNPHRIPEPTVLGLLGLGLFGLGYAKRRKQSEA